LYQFTTEAKPSTTLWEEPLWSIGSWLHHRRYFSLLVILVSHFLEAEDGSITLSIDGG
jgi:hypothetical protein